VLDAAIARGSQLIVAYHPPLFTSFKRLNRSNVKDRIVIKCLEHKIAIYSPHTALDVVKGGINDWIANNLAAPSTSTTSTTTSATSETKAVAATTAATTTSGYTIEVLEPQTEIDSQQTHKVVVMVPEDRLIQVRDALAAIGCGHVGN
jgi:putative NIF3 family GTP cyclohydrolase 1 type 2